VDNPCPFSLIERERLNFTGEIRVELGGVVSKNDELLSGE